jgi:hypothetical protein
MDEARRGQNAAAWRSPHKALFKQERFNNVFDGVTRFP